MQSVSAESENWSVISFCGIGNLDTYMFRRPMDFMMREGKKRLFDFLVRNEILSLTQGWEIEENRYKTTEINMGDARQGGGLGFSPLAGQNFRIRKYLSGTDGEERAVASLEAKRYRSLAASVQWMPTNPPSALPLK